MLSTFARENIMDRTREIVQEKGLHVAALYSSGEYFKDIHRHTEDAEFKARCFLKLFIDAAKKLRLSPQSYIDVGCGGGEAVLIISRALQQNGFNLNVVRAYDVSPHVQTLRSDSVEYINADFAESQDYADLVTLFDVLEHVVDPLNFLRRIGDRCQLLGLHIPLDHSILNAFRDKFRVLLKDPGHLLFMDTAFALNLLTLAGMKVVAYRYTFGFRAPSGHASLLSKFLFPIRLLLSKLSPWLLSKTVGGASLMVLVATPRGLRSSAPNS
jgi:SAM-dependent methyltransferase